MLKDKIESLIYKMELDEKVKLNNEYCSQVGCMNSYIFKKSDLNIVLEDKSPLEIAALIGKCTLWGKFNIHSDYFRLHNNMIMSVWDIYKSDMSNVINYIIKQYNSLNNEEIQKILEEAEEAL